jgi:PHD/YefM family antitoxin component YafN of YafNO toxin-antitoxin module
MRTIPAREIKRRGIGAVDALLCEGPVHVIKNDRPSYVILTEGQYEELVESMEEATLARVKASLEDVKAGRVHRYKNLEELMNAIEQSAQD